MNFLDSPYDFLFARKEWIFSGLLFLAGLGLIWDLIAKNRRSPQETLANALIFVANNAVNLFLAQALQLAALGWFFTWAPWQIPTNLPTLLLCLLGVDFCYYWRHRWEHEIHLLWAEHSVHHSSEEFNFSTSLRLPAITPLFGWIFFAPLALLGFPAKLVIACYFINLLYQYWVHNGGIGKLGWLEHVLSTPSNHRVHHARNPKYLDKNYGGVLILWDKLFGSYEPERLKPDFGIVQPIATRNPILINVRPFARLYAKAAAQPGWKQKMKAIFGKP